MRITHSLIIVGAMLAAVNGHAQSDTPCDAPLLEVHSAACVFTTHTTEGATYQSDVANGGVPPCAFPAAPDVWFRVVVPPSGAIAITSEPGTMTDGGLAVYSGPCTAPQLIECDDDAAVGFMPVVDRTDYTPGETLYVRFWRSANPGTGTFSICAVESHSDCNKAVRICQDQHVDGTPYGPGSTMDELAEFCDISEFQSIWFSFRFISGGTFSFLIQPDPLQGGFFPDIDWLLFHAPDNTFCESHTPNTEPLACNGSSSYGPFGQTGLDPEGLSNAVPAGSGNPYCPVITVNTGDLYYLFVNNYTTSSTGFLLNLGGTAQPTCDDVDVGFHEATARLTRFEAFPVPAHDAVVINGTTTTERLDLTDAVGRATKVVYPNGVDQFRIPLDGLAPGSYTLRGSDADGNPTGWTKVVVQ